MAEVPAELTAISERLVPFWKDFRKESDRGAAILAMCALEEVAREGIHKRLGPFVGEMKNICAPLGRWSAIATVAEAFGLLTKSERKDLSMLIEVRNRFAHRPMTELSFDDPEINKLISQLKLFERTMAGIGNAGMTQSNRIRYLSTVGVLYYFMSARTIDAKPLKPCEELNPLDGDAPLVAGGW